jgi:hypothetical protein
VVQYRTASSKSMGRPVASIANRRFAIAIAKLITVPTGNQLDTVARSGVCSIFSFLRRLFPCIVRDGNSGLRDGISEVELNKALQVNIASLVKTIQKNKSQMSPWQYGWLNSALCSPCFDVCITCLGRRKASCEFAIEKAVPFAAKEIPMELDFTSSGIALAQIAFRVIRASDKSHRASDKSHKSPSHCLKSKQASYIPDAYHHRSLIAHSRQ